MTIEDTALLRQHFNHSLPVVDFGCGFGKHTLALSSFFNKVIGVDASQVVIDKNNQNPLYSEIEFSQFDGLSIPEVTAMHSTLGDCNVYIKGVLHQIQTKDREFIAQSLKTLLGQGGALFIHEVDRMFLNDLTTQKFSDLPFKLRQILAGSLLPLGIDKLEIETLFLDTGHYELRHYGQRNIETGLSFKTGQKVCVPCHYFCIAKKTQAK